MFKNTTYLVEHTYNVDKLGRVLTKITKAGNITGYNTHNYFVEGNKVLTELIQTTKYGLIRFDYNYDINNNLVSVEFQNQVYFYIRDALGVIQSIVDKNGNIVVKYSYNEWGKLLGTVTSNANHPLVLFNPFIYKGYYYDVETQLFYCNSRYYSPELCRFISPDSIEYLDPSSINGLNLYAYCGNNPVNKYDPTGHIAWWVIALIVVGVATIATSSGAEVNF